MPTNIPLIFSFILIPISSFFLWLPWSTHVAFFHPPPTPSSSAAAANLNLDSCSPLPPGPEWCAEPIIHRESRLAYFHCDDTRPWWDPLTQTWGRAPEGRKAGSVWTWDLKDPTSQPQQLHLLRPTTRSHEPFHPLSLSVVSLKSSNASNVLLIANHPRARAPGVVDVYRHDLGHDSAVQYDRIEGHALGDKNPYRIDAVPEKWSAPVEAPEGLSAQEGSEKLEPLAIPSFLFTSIAMPECPASDDDDAANTTPSSSSCPRRPGRTTAPTLPQYLLDVLPLPSFLLSLFTTNPTPYSPSHPITINYYLSTPHSTRPIFSTLSSHPTSPPLLRHWSALGPRGGVNTSLPHAYVVSNSGKAAMLEQWDQHWVGASASVDGRGEVMTDGRSFKDVWVKWPSMVTFWSAPLGGKGGGPVAGMDVDEVGRVWTVGAVSQGEVVRRVEELRRRGAAGEDEDEDEDGMRETGSAGALIRQTTYIHRLGGAIGHPWEVERLARVKKRGVWLPKEFYSTVVYRLGLGAAPSPKSGKGYLPGAPTGVAVDEVGRRVLVTSSWEKRGAVCAFKEGWVEENGEGSV